MAIKELRMCDPCAEDGDETIAVKTITFVKDKKDHELDVCQGHDETYRRLQEQLDSFQALGRMVVKGRRRPPAAQDQQHPASPPPATPPRGDRSGESARLDKNRKIREWAAEQGIDLPERGRIPDDVKERYEAANPAA
jgi:hypothetical protein